MPLMSMGDIGHRIMRHGIKMPFVDGPVPAANEDLEVIQTGMADIWVDADDEETC
jgi:hypothetical protein